MAISLLAASADERFRETVRESLINIENAKVVSEYPEVSSNLYIRVLQDLERHPQAALIVDLAADLEGALKVLEKVKLAAPELYVIASSHHADAEAVIATLRAGASDFLIQPLRRMEFRDAMARLARAPRRAVAGASRLGKIFSDAGASRRAA
jgi:pilus assembly protein CpaE